MSDSTPNILAIVGRPNVGKSTLFNRIIGRPMAIVHEQPGVTRDRISATAQWGGKTFEVIDTGGIAFLEGEKTGDALAAATQQQAEVAIELARVIVLVVDVTAGLTALDRDIARRLRISGKTVLLAVNKVDNPKRDQTAPEFAELGFAQTFSVAAAHGLGVANLLDAATESFGGGPAAESVRPTRVTIVGRPNVGKSSLINCLLQSERTIVSEIPGTTRDAVDVPFTLDGRPYMLVDTAGLRHRRKIKTSVDQFGLMRAERSIRQCDIAVLVLDARDGVTQQDKNIAGQIVEAGRGCAIVVNKWDLAAREEAPKRSPRPGGGGPKTKKSFRDEYVEAVRRELFFLDWAPVLFVSAKTGRAVDELIPLLDGVDRELGRRVETPQLNQLLRRCLESNPPPLAQGRRFKVYYAFQKPVRPPTFVLFVNHAGGLIPHYQRYLIDKLRGAWGFAGCPVALELRARSRPAGRQRPVPGKKYG